MLILQKIEMSWQDCRDPREIEPYLLEEGIGETTARINRYDNTLISTEVQGILPSDVPLKFTQLQNVLRGKCHTIKFHFQSNNSGEVPVKELEKVGFEPSDSFIWRLKHSDFEVYAIAIPNVRRDPYWILQASNRRGKGLNATACEIATLLQTQLELELPIEQKVS